MAKALPLKIIPGQPVGADMSLAHDVSGYANTPAAPPQMSANFITPINVPQPKAWRPSALAVLDGVLGGATFTESRRAEEDRHRAEAALPQMEALRSRMMTDLSKAGPDELKAYLTNPTEFGKNMATRLAAADVAAGSSRVYGNPDQGGSVYTAPKVDTAAGQAFSYGPDGVTALGAVPFVPDYQTVGEGGKAVPKMPVLPPGFGGASSLAAGLPQVGDAPRAPATTGQPRSVRNNNPGNLEDGAFARSQPGYKGSDGRFAIFESPDAGSQAQVTLLSSYGKRGIDTVEGIINRWAPPTENDTGGYVDFVARKVGVAPGQKLDMTDPGILTKVAGAIRQFEGGPQSRSNRPSATAAAPSDPAGTIYGAPKAPAAAPSGYRWNGATLEFIPGGPADPAVKTTAGLKPVPAKIQQSLIENNATIQQIDDAIAAIQANPSAMGLKNYAGDGVTQRTDPEGIAVRAKVANVGSQLIHDRSGAAVTASETPRLKPFVPSATDTPDAAVKKLLSLRQQAENASNGIELAYGEDSGYRPLGTASAGSKQGGARPAGWSAALPAPQLAVAKQFKGATAPAGDPGNPFLPRSAAEFKNIPPGKSYIDDDGSIQVKR